MAMASEKTTSAMPYKPRNKAKRQAAYLKHKKLREGSKRDERFRRRRAEDKDPILRAERRERNVPMTIDRKRTWDEVDAEEGDALGRSVDIASIKRQKKDEEAEQNPAVVEGTDEGALTETNLKKVEQLEDDGEALTLHDEEALDEDDEGEDEDEDGEAASDDLGSIMDEDSADEGEVDDRGFRKPANISRSTNDKARAPSPTAASTTSTNLSLIPDALAAKFPQIFSPPATDPKILITTNLNGTVHAEASLLTTLFPNAIYIPRTRHRHNSHHFSLREIARYAANRAYTHLVVVAEDLKRPSGLTVIHLPDGPTFHFSISNWVEGKKLPGHGNPTVHYPELILNNFRTPLGVLTAALWRGMFIAKPELQGRQVVTLHNQRDYVFVRRHRYVFREKRKTEKQVVGSDGKVMRGAEEIRAGLQELGPRFTLKLRRVDKGVQRVSGQEWVWKGGNEKERTKFAL